MHAIETNASITMLCITLYYLSNYIEIIFAFLTINIIFLKYLEKYCYIIHKFVLLK